VPELDLVLAINAGLYKTSLQTPMAITILNQYVLRAISPRSPQVAG